MKVIRSMKPDADGLPTIGDTGKTLGPRMNNPDAPDDIEVDADGFVHPNTGGMSVSLPPVTNLRPHRIPERLGGDGKNIEVFELGTVELPGELLHRPDPNKATHGFIEPSTPMKFEEYQQALRETRQLWRIFCP